MKRLDFLTAFFVALGVVFIVAVAIRVRSYDPPDPAAEPTAAPATVREESTVHVVEPLATMIEIPSAPSSPRKQTRTTTGPAVPYAASPLPSTRRGPAVTPSATAPPAFSQAVPVPATSTNRAAVPSRAGAGESAASAERRNPADRTAGAPSSQGPSSDTPPRTEQTPPLEADDPTSDSSPPRLATVEFIPPQVADGEETLLIIHASDDLSGIRSISGTIIAPSGAVQGFACQREADTNRFVARVVVPKEAADGVWSINYLNLTDHASNSMTITAARGGLPPTASFRVVSSRPDSQGPSLQAIWVDRRSMRGGEKNIVFVRAEDDKAGVNLVSGVFQSPSRQARLGFVCRSTGDGLWTCEMVAPACADCGEWQLEQLQLQDKANNMTTLRVSQNEMVTGVRVDISSELCDATPPALQTVALDRTVVSNIEPSTILVTASLTDDACGILSVSGQASGPVTGGGAPPRLYFSFTPGGDPSTWVGRLIVPRQAAKGMWRVSFLQLLDRGQNLKTYTQNDPLLATTTFIVD